jgi:hypothetical protein
MKYGSVILILFLLTFYGQKSSAAIPNSLSQTNNDFTLVETLSGFKSYIAKDNVKVRLKAGNYQIDDAKSIRFMQFTGNNSHFDLTGVRFMVDTKLFNRSDLAKSDDGNSMYCAIEISGNNTILEGLYIETYGDTPGRQSKNKIFNIVGEDVTLKNVEVRTAGSSPWGYGYLYGLGGGDVRKMNGIRIAYPAKNVKLIGCKVHMRAMGHAIFLQGAENTLIEDCHVDGLLRTTDAILAETSGYGFDKNFYAPKGGYIEGTIVAEDGKILPGEIISLSEDGIRMYPEYKGHPTKNTTIKNCTVFQMRRGICTGLSTSGDKVVNCKVTNCVATGFNVGNNDTLINCSSDAKYAEAFCITNAKARNAYVEMEILDSRNGMANNLLAAINGIGHHVIIKTSNPSFIPESMAIELSTRNGYAFYQRSGVSASDIQVDNQTETIVRLLPGTENEEILSKGLVVRNTLVTIQGEKFHINGIPTYNGRTWKGYPIEGLLMNSRMVQGIFDDLNPETADRWKYTDTQKWDANRNTNEFVKAMDSWYASGLLAFTINMQGGSPLGYGNKGWINSAFDTNGELRPEYMARLQRILNKADEIGMVAILGLFYNDQEDLLENEAAVLNGVDNIINWLFKNNYRNVIIEINNECNLKYRHEILQPQRVHEVINRIKSKEQNGSLYKNQFLPLNFGLNIAVLSLCLGFYISFLFDKPTGSNGLKMILTGRFFQN